MIKLSQEQSATAKAKNALSYKPNIEDLQMESDDDQSEGSGSDEGSQSESDVEEDMGREMSSDGESSSEEPAKKNVYKAPKLNAVAFEDPKDKKARQKESYERKKLGKSNLM